MRRKWWMRGCSLALAAVLAVGLTGCSRGGNSAGGGGRNAESTDPSLAKQYVFAGQELDLDFDGDSTNVLAVRVVDDRVNVVAEVYHWTRSDVGNSQDYRWVTMKQDGTDIQSVRLQFPEAENVTDAPEEPVDEDDAADGDDMVHIYEEDDAEIALDVYYEGEGSDENIYYGNFCITDNGYLYGIRTNSRSEWSNEDNYYHYESTYSVCSWDAEGNYLWEKPFEGLKSTDEEWHDIRNLVSLGDGKFILVITGDMEYSAVEMDAEGNTSAPRNLPVGGEKLMNSYDFIDKGNGEFVLTYYDDSWQNMYLATYDIRTDTIKEEAKLPDSFAWSGYNSLSSGISTDIVYSNSTGIWGLSGGDEQPAQIMSFINSDMLSTYLNYIVMLDDEHFIAMYDEEDETGDYHTVMSLFTKRNPEEIPDKQVLVLAANYLNSDVRRRVVQFNKKSENYRIVTKEYDSLATADDYMAGYTQLNNDIISGSMPDILVYDDWLPIDNYISKGLLADIDALIEQDEELSKKEFLDNVFEAYRVKGKLYAVLPAFSVQTVIGKKSVLGDRTSWTFAELQSIMAQQPEGTLSFGETTKDSFMNMFLRYCGSDLVDASTGKCNFDSQYFIDMLEYANTFPETIDYDYDDDAAWRNYWNDYQSQYRDGRTLLMPAYIGSLRDMNYQINGYFGEDVSYVGFPSESGAGSIIYPQGSAFVLSAKSAHQDAAWEFVRYYLTDEYQDTLEWTLPVGRSQFDKLAGEATQKNYWIDENGEKVEYSDYFELNGESIELEPLTQAQVDQLTDFVLSVKTANYYNENILNMVQEEAAGFFAGQKSAADVAKVIQSRAQIYVDENR